jgi:hypothetical protein
VSENSHKLFLLEVVELLETTELADAEAKLCNIEAHIQIPINWHTQIFDTVHLPAGGQ